MVSTTSDVLPYPVGLYVKLLPVNVGALVRHEVTQQIAEKAALSIWGNPTITGTSGNAVVRSIWDNAGKLIA